MLINLFTNQVCCCIIVTYGADLFLSNLKRGDESIESCNLRSFIRRG